MTFNEAKDHALTISREYGRTVIFREPVGRESYQAMISCLPKGAKVVATFDAGKMIDFDLSE